MKKFTAALIAFCMVFALIGGISVGAVENISGVSGEVSWSLDSDGVFTVSGEGAMADYTSADEVPWKNHFSAIKSVVIGENVTRVSDYGFYGCTNIGSVTFKNDYLCRIGEMTFYNCENLKTVAIPAGVKEIGYGAFGCDEADKGLDSAYIYARKTWFESCDDIESPLVDTNAMTFPEHTVIYGHASSDSYWYAGNNGRTFRILEDGQVIKIENGGDATYEFDDLSGSKVIDLWKSKDAEVGSEHGVMLDYTFTVDVSDVVSEYNYLPDGGDFYKLGYDKGNGGEIEFETEIIFDNEYQSSRLWGNAYYSLCETDYKGNARDYYKKWKTSVSDSFITMTSDGENLTVNIKGSMKDIYEAACRYNSSLDEYKLTDFAIIVKVDGITYYRGWGNSVYDESHQVDYHSLWFYDAHSRDVFAPDAPAWSYEYLIEVEDYPQYDLPGYYEPVKKEYFWIYEFSKRKYEEIYNEETGEYEYYYYGFFDDGFEMEPGKSVYTEKAPDGKDYGVCFGEFDAGESNKLRIKQLLNDENRAFIDSMIGLKPDGDGGPVHLGLICNVMLTFPDGETVCHSVNLDNEMNKLVAPCVHSCKICGACTVTDKALPCNYHYSFGEAMFHCVCEDPDPVEIAVENVSTTNTTTANMEAPVTVVVDKVDMTTAADTDFIEHITQDIREYEVQEVYNIDVYDEYSGNPYMLNQWGGSGETLTVVVPVSAETAEELSNGEADIYHIDGDGTAEKVEDALVEFDGENAVVNLTSDTFSPFVITSSEKTPDEPEKPLDKVSVYIGSTAGGSVAADKVSANTVESVSAGTSIKAEATASDGYKFAYWKDSAGNFVSENATYTFKAYTNTSIVAVFDAIGESAASAGVEFFDGNRDYLGFKAVEKGTIFGEVEKPSYGITGYTFTGWNVANDTAINSIIRAVAQYSEKGNNVSGITLNGNGKTANYGDAITETVAGAKAWYRDGKLVAYGDTYTYFAWGNTAIASSTEDVAEKLPLVVLNKSDDAYMIEYDSAGYEIVDAGILFGNDSHKEVNSCYYKAKVKNIKAHGQFTAKKSLNTKYDQSAVRGYIIYKNTDGTLKIAYAD